MKRILDSTLRDGSYAFGNSMPLSYVKHIGSSLDQLVEYIEVGSAISFGFGTENALEEDLIRLDCLNEIIRVSKSAIFIQPSLLSNYKVNLKRIISSKPSIIRIGIDPELNNFLDLDFLSLIESNKIDYCLNLMKAYKYSDDQLNKIINIANSSSKCLAINIVDSSGCMSENEVFNIASKLSQLAKSNIGVHIHNNIGLANKISYESLDRGYSADSTLLGKGRMGGNADTILLILYSALKNTGNIKQLDEFIQKILNCTSIIWGHEAREHILSLMIGLTGLHSSKLSKNILSSLDTLPNLTTMISNAWNYEK